MNIKEEIKDERLKIIRLDNFPKTNSFSEDVRIGLTSESKFLLPKYFYDLAGSELFEKICETEEYYPTRSEISILQNLSDTISHRNKDKNLIVELGSGSSFKTNHILQSFLKTRSRLNYIPIDVSDILIESSKNLIEKYDGLFITGIVSFYEEGIDYVVNVDKSPKLILFLGSSIGNFTEDEAIDFMKMLSNDVSIADRLLIGFDLVKDRNILTDAYNDKGGITAEFNLNILRRINTELGGNFDLEKFEHSAKFNEEKSRMEMHLISKEDQTVVIKNIEEKVFFKKGETIHTENSYKYTHDMINDLAEASNMEFSDIYTDVKGFFALCAFKLKK
ncbi:MAG: L-histidine N(alpha)-methyltransferase [Ignavibacteria bacterium]